MEAMKAGFPKGWGLVTCTITTMPLTEGYGSMFPADEKVKSFDYAKKE